MGREIILVLDFGGQYTHLISRRVRDLGVYSEILPFDVSAEKIGYIEQNLKGIILSGGPSSVYDENAPKIDEKTFKFILSKKIPLLGLCYGHQLIAQVMKGKVDPNINKEYGKTVLEVSKPNYIFKGLKKLETVWMSHGDQVTQLPEGFEIFGKTPTCPIAAYGDPIRKVFGLQFHPEVKHTECGNQVLSNFLFSICKCSGTWKMDEWIKNKIEEIRAKIKDEGVILGVSGGVDSTVLAVLLNEAIGHNVHPIFINNGLLRKNETEEVVAIYKDELKFKNFHYIDAENIFLEKLKEIDDPEEKRKIIGHTFVEIFERKAEDLKKTHENIKNFAQGTIFPDRVESATTSKSAAVIKTHHNTALPENMKLSLLEPLKDLYKDEVRKIGKELKISEKILKRQPFPGPGLAVRHLGSVKKETLEILREADQILRDEIDFSESSDDLWQYFAVLLPIKTVGVMGDFRTYEYICALRIVESKEAMTANFAKLDWDLLEHISTRIINEVRGFNRVVYDISNKPPSTIEFE